MMCSQTPDTTIPIAKPEKPLTKPPRNVAKTKGRRRCPSMGARSKGKRAALAWGHPLDGEAAGSPCHHTRSNAGDLQRTMPEKSGAPLPGRLESIRPRHRPGIAEARIVSTVEQFARAQRRIEPCERADFRR